MSWIDLERGDEPTIGKGQRDTVAAFRLPIATGALLEAASHRT